MSNKRLFAAFRGTGLIPGQSPEISALRKICQTKVIAQAPDVIAATAASLAGASAVSAFTFGATIDDYARCMLAAANSTDNTLSAQPKSRIDSVRAKLAPGILLTAPEYIDTATATEVAKKKKEVTGQAYVEKITLSKRNLWTAKLQDVKRQVEFAMSTFRPLCPEARAADFTALEKWVESEMNAELRLVSKATVEALKKMRMKNGAEFDAEARKVASQMTTRLDLFGHSYVTTLLNLITLMTLTTLTASLLKTTL